MKKTYLQPAMMVVTLQQHSIICTSKGVSRVSTNLTDEGDAIGYGGGRHRSRPREEQYRGLGRRLERVDEYLKYRFSII